MKRKLIFETINGQLLYFELPFWSSSQPPLPKRSAIEIFPNPTNGILNINGDFNTASLEDYNSLGQKTSTYRLQSGNTHIEFKVKGFYILLFTVDGELIGKKVMVR